MMLKQKWSNINLNKILIISVPISHLIVIEKQKSNITIY